MRATPKYQAGYWSGKGVACWLQLQCRCCKQDDCRWPLSGIQECCGSNKCSAPHIGGVGDADERLWWHLVGLWKLLSVLAVRLGTQRPMSRRACCVQVRAGGWQACANSSEGAGTLL